MQASCGDCKPAKEGGEAGRQTYTRDKCASDMSQDRALKIQKIRNRINAASQASEMERVINGKTFLLKLQHQMYRSDACVVDSNTLILESKTFHDSQLRSSGRLNANCLTHDEAHKREDLISQTAVSGGTARLAALRKRGFTTKLR